MRACVEHQPIESFAVIGMQAENQNRLAGIKCSQHITLTTR
jgi:hypothetical protein